MTGTYEGAPVPPATVVVAPPLTVPPPSSPHASALAVKTRRVIARIGPARFMMFSRQVQRNLSPAARNEACSDARAWWASGTQLRSECRALAGDRRIPIYYT